MRVVWFSWKDRYHPLAGGAEIVSNNIREKLAQDGHEVLLFTARYKGSSRKETISGVQVRRYGNRLTVYLLCLAQFMFLPRSAFDIVIDEMNTLPFWVGAFTRKPKLLLSYQLAREVWYYQLKPPFSTIGYKLEPIYLKILARFYPLAITESNSTSIELMAHGFKSVDIFRVGMDLKPIVQFRPATSSQMNNLVFLGALRPMKRPLDAIKAFEIAKKNLSDLTLTIVGSDVDSHASLVKQYVLKSKYTNSIHLIGSVTGQEKVDTLKSAGAIITTSVKEGWGLIVSEAGSQGTPAIAYDADGLRDSVKDGVTGILAVNNDISDLARQVVRLLSDTKKRNTFGKNAWVFSKQFTFDNSYRDFLKSINKVI